MAEFTICYRMVCNGSVTVKADDEAAAKAIVENMELSILGEEAEDGEVEIVSVDGLSVD